MINLELIEKRYFVEKNEKWREICNNIPFLNFKEDWDIKIIPPFSGAIIRFFIKKGEKEISVYLDWYDNLGYMNEPYWEIYDFKKTYRFLLNETSEMMEKIKRLLK